ncbi:MAG: Na/Pi cotransporter family protein [Flavobacteriaceae bacterium]|nr:Na/Pi cotransporter family protein [Muriicola sp.]NNC60877.1 Na/Pi cotransporter family protein [Eudoraea sp.]NNK19765.1 Na/Pi cotransporter family protein [Flavobacteriaceae bacterium]MBT8290211.1 Na/Pi cotransporter family protein [Muriicola sp.]NNK35405.1 Na/Pi cotransporter family protein [Eudoraea sp.]
MEFGLVQTLQLLGSLGLFLFGMKVMSDALLLLAGNRMRNILATMTSNRFLGITTGFLITSVIQSSSATTLMVVSFSNASLLTLTESISVIMGANIGTTITAWLITLLGFKVSMSAIALPLVGFGFLFMFSKKEKLKNWGGFIIGFAVLFIGLQFLKENMPDINQNPGILEFLNNYTELGFGSVLLFLFIGTVLTIVVQSSSATMALTLLMTAEGWIPFDLAAAMVLGENIGTTITANLAAIVANFHAKRTARAHLIFNLLGVLWMLILFYPFLNLISWVSQRLGSESPYISAAAIPVAISLFHTFFNVLNTFFLVWFITPISKIVVWSVPEKAEPEREIDEPKYLNEKILQYPETAIASLLKESKYLFQNAIFEIVTHALNIHREDVKSDLKAKKVVKKSIEDFKTDVRALYLSKVKKIYGEIIRYATNTQSTLKISKAQNSRILEIKVANRKMVEILRDVKELNRNVSTYFVSENKYMKKEYNLYRKLAVQVLRMIYDIPGDDGGELQKKLMVLRKKTNEKLSEHNVQIDQLIRKNLITTDMASSLVNDNDNVRDVLNNLITVAELLYCRRDTLFSPVGDHKEPLKEVA